VICFASSSTKPDTSGRFGRHWETHHIIPQRFWSNSPALQRIFKHVDDIPGVNLTKAEHQLITELWRKYLPYSNQAGRIANPTIEQIVDAAAKVYGQVNKGSHMFKAVLLSLL
jgi:hypothetical protein